MASPLHFLRRAVQAFAFFWSNSYLRVLVTGRIYRGPLKGTCVPFLNCQSCPLAAFSCPVGAVQHYMAIHRLPYLIVGQLGLVGMLVGRMACGWFCPFGLLQDLLFKGRNGGLGLPRALGALRWLVLLGLVVLLPWQMAEDWFCKLCPPGILSAEIPWSIWNPKDPASGQPLAPHRLWGWALAANLGILGGVIALSRVSKRPFCRLACPLGLFFSFFNRWSLLELRVSPGCDRCDTCHRACPMHLKVYENPDAGECIRCLECTRCAHVKPVLRLPFAAEPRVSGALKAPSPSAQVGDRSP